MSKKDLESELKEMMDKHNEFTDFIFRLDSMIQDFRLIGLTLLENLYLIKSGKYFQYKKEFIKLKLKYKLTKSDYALVKSFLGNDFKYISMPQNMDSVELSQFEKFALHICGKYINFEKDFINLKNSFLNLGISKR